MKPPRPAKSLKVKLAPSNPLLQGAVLQADGSVRWRIWAPLVDSLSLLIHRGRRREAVAMQRESGGYFTCRLSNVKEGLRYTFQFADGSACPDPTSRRQPEGVFRPSAVWFPNSYRWHDAGWRGIEREKLVIYELHVGTFTPEGTFAAIIPRLAELAELGVTCLELMPVAQFSGERNWGYDGVFPFAVQKSYGGPRALQQFIDAAHQHALAVFLDVVYNHFGPEGNFFDRFGPYHSDRYRTPWGAALNFYGPDSDAVRRLVIDNACYWVREFHVDGLRLDAVHAIYDFSARHILEEIAAAVHAEAARLGRRVHVIAESNLNDVRLLKSPARGGYGLDAVWSDDFHHSVHALLTGERDGYYQDFGRPEHLAKAYNQVFVYDGCYSPFRRRRHGSRVGKLARTRFIHSIQNHDQVGNRALGERLTTLLPPPALRLACALLMLSPCVPLLWMGEEFGETRPFPFFCSFSDKRLIAAVRRGRRKEFAALAFLWDKKPFDPQSPRTFTAARLQWDWKAKDRFERRRLYGELLAARRDWPALKDTRHTSARLVNVRPLSPEDSSQSAEDAILVLRRGRGKEMLIACANLSDKLLPLPDERWAKQAPRLSTEQQCYGGGREIEAPVKALLPYEMLIFFPNR